MCKGVWLAVNPFSGRENGEMRGYAWVPLRVLKLNFVSVFWGKMQHRVVSFTGCNIKPRVSNPTSRGLKTLP